MLVVRATRDIIKALTSREEVNLNEKGRNIVVLIGNSKNISAFNFKHHEEYDRRVAMTYFTYDNDLCNVLLVWDNFSDSINPGQYICGLKLSNAKDEFDLDYVSISKEMLTCNIISFLVNTHLLAVSGRLA